MKRSREESVSPEPRKVNRYASPKPSYARAGPREICDDFDIDRISASPSPPHILIVSTLGPYREFISDLLVSNGSICEIWHMANAISDQSPLQLQWNRSNST